MILKRIAVAMIFFIVTYLTEAQSPVNTAVIAPLPTRIFDFAHKISLADSNRLAIWISGFEARTTNQFMVVTLDDLGGIPAKEYAEEFISKKDFEDEKKNKILFLIVYKEQKVILKVTGKELEQRLDSIQVPRIDLRREVDVASYMIMNQIEAIHNQSTNKAFALVPLIVPPSSFSAVQEDDWRWRDKIPAITLLLIVLSVMGRGIYHALQQRFHIFAG